VNGENTTPTAETVEGGVIAAPVQSFVHPFYERDGITIHNARCEDVLAGLPDDSIDLIVTDPPYFKVKSEWWDRQWDKPETFLAWMGGLCDQWRRVLKPNGSLYVFASPQMAWGVEGEVRKRFNVVNRIVWSKSSDPTKAIMYGADVFRGYVPKSEQIIFAEHFNADNHAKGEAGYGAKCDELRGFVFEPLRAYLAGERDKAGWTTRRVAEAFQKKTGSRTVTGMAGHWFERVQWALPTAENYHWLQELFNRQDGDYLRREYDYLRREYEDMRQEYEDMRRPFNASEKRPYTDVWDYATVSDYPGKHPCEKPLAMMEHIIETSSRDDAVILDCFAGSGVVGKAARNYGRRAILCEVEERWYRRIVNELRQGSMWASVG